MKHFDNRQQLILVSSLFTGESGCPSSQEGGLSFYGAELSTTISIFRETKERSIMYKAIAPVTLVALLLASCGGENEQPIASDSPAGESASPVLTAVGEIGIELGDSNYVFGIIQDVDIASDGTVFVLDSRKKKVMAYSSQGDFLGSFGGEGEAPGEFLNPMSVACLEDGRIAVSDPFSREVEIFNRDFSYSETVADFTERAPFVITATDRGFAGEQGGFNRDEGTVTQRVMSWDLQRDTICVLFETESNFSQDNMAARFMEPQAGIVSTRGTVYFSPPVTDEYVVHAYPIGDGPTDPLTWPGYDQVRRSREEIDAEIQLFEDRLQAMAASGRGSRFAEMEYNPPEFYYATASMGVDSRGRIWVQRGWESDPVFDLFMPGDTAPGETVYFDCEDELSDCEFVITPYGFAAFERDPEYYPRVFLLELDE